MMFYKTNIDLLDEYDRRVFGHEEAKKTLITLVNRSKMRHYQKFVLGLGKEDLIQPMKVLLIGASGTGKTFLVQQLQEICQFPLLCIDATELNPTGASGGITRQKLQKMIYDNAYEYDKYYSEKGYTNSVEGLVDKTVVFVDEIDKLAKNFDSSGNWNKHVQSNFLTLFDNYEEYAGVSFVFAGAFSGMEREKASRGIGFSAVTTESDEILDEAIVKYGLLPELIGRLTRIIELDSFKEDDYKRILQDELLPKKRYDLSYYGHTLLELPEQFIERAIKKAISSGQGVRYLKRELDKYCLDMEFNYEDSAGYLSLPHWGEESTSLYDEYSDVEELGD